MKILSSFALAGTIALGLTAAAHAQSAQIPTPANPYPANPVATNGTPLDRPVYGAEGALLTGRSAYAPAGVVDAGLGTAGALVGSGVGLATGAVDAGVGVAGGAVDAGTSVVR